VPSIPTLSCGQIVSNPPRLGCGEPSATGAEALGELDPTLNYLRDLGAPPWVSTSESASVARVNSRRHRLPTQVALLPAGPSSASATSSRREPPHEAAHRACDGGDSLARGEGGDQTDQESRSAGWEQAPE
jgi:hypothetical protein